MTKKILILITMIMILPATVLSKVSTELPKNLEVLINELVLNNRKLSSLEKRAVAIKDGALAAKALPDPVFGVGISNLPTNGFDFNQEPMTQKQIFVSQKIPWLSKLDIKAEIEKKKFYTAKAYADLEKAVLARSLSNLYFDLMYSNNEISANNQLIIIIEDIIKSNDSGYALGSLKQQDILKAFLELERLKERKLSLNKEKSIVEIKINKILNRKSFKNIKIETNPVFPVFDYSRDDIYKKALNKNPELKLLKKISNEKTEKVKFFKKSLYPDMGFKAVYGQRGSDSKGNDLSDFFSFSASFTIPLWKERSQDIKIKSARITETSSLNNIENFMIELPHKIDELIESLSLKKERVRIYENSIIPSAEKLSAASLNDYRVGREDFNIMMRSRMEIIELKLKMDKLKIDAQRDIAEILYLTGEIIMVKN
jgi:outer membrane protein TolC